MAEQLQVSLKELGCRFYLRQRSFGSVRLVKCFCNSVWMWGWILPWWRHLAVPCSRVLSCVLIWRLVCFTVKAGVVCWPVRLHGDSKGQESERGAGSSPPAETLETNCCWRSNNSCIVPVCSRWRRKMLLEVWMFVFFTPLGRSELHASRFISTLLLCRESLEWPDGV